MTRRQLKHGCFVIEGVNAFAATLYSYYLFFFLTERFRFTDRDNLCVSALHGFVYMFAAWYGGLFAQRRGYFFSLKVGIIAMLAMLVISSQITSSAGLLVMLALWTIGACFTWPALEALVAEGEAPGPLQKLLGTYNVVWAGGNALAFFTGGAIQAALGPKTLFWLPVTLHALQLVFIVWLEKQSRHLDVEPTPATEVALAIEANPRPISRTKIFLKLAWIANPFAYIAINTVVPLIPGMAKKLELSAAQAGFVCSIWFFARLATFWLLRQWSGWHYKFRYFIGAFALLLASFAAILLAPSIFKGATLAVIVVAQIAFGLAVGLIYYSSLFYSMDVGDTKGEHGGIHEAAIGLGIFVGPAVGATTLYFRPESPNSGIVAVSVLLLAGLVGCVALWVRAKR